MDEDPGSALVMGLTADAFLTLASSVPSVSSVVNVSFPLALVSSVPSVPLW
jgi:hypothetical protein